MKKFLEEKLTVESVLYYLGHPVQYMTGSMGSSTVGLSESLGHMDSVKYTAVGFIHKLTKKKKTLKKTPGMVAFS